MKEQKDAAKEALDAAAFAQFPFGPRRRQAGAVLLAGAGSKARQPQLQAWCGSRR